MLHRYVMLHKVYKIKHSIKAFYLLQRVLKNCVPDEPRLSQICFSFLSLCKSIASAYNDFYFSPSKHFLATFYSLFKSQLLSLLLWEMGLDWEKPLRTCPLWSLIVHLQCVFFITWIEIAHLVGCLSSLLHGKHCLVITWYLQPQRQCLVPESCSINVVQRNQSFGIINPVGLSHIRQAPGYQIRPPLIAYIK